MSSSAQKWLTWYFQTFQIALECSNSSRTGFDPKVEHQDLTGFDLCMCVKAREVHGRLVPVSALEPVSCQIVQCFPISYHFVIPVTLSLLVFVFLAFCSTGKKAFLMNAYCESSVFQLKYHHHSLIPIW